MPTNISYTKLADRNVSFGLIRTNPKLTSNVKLTVDSAGDLWLNSIDAINELANRKYKKFRVNPNSNHPVNIYKFYDYGNTPSNISFALGSTINTDSVASNLKDQYDFDLYSSGAKYLTSRLYDEKFSYFAPLYLDKVLPEYFVIFKIPGASNYTVGEWKSKLADPNFSKSDFALDLFKNAKAVKTILIDETTNIGKYIRRIQLDKQYNKNPLYINFKNGADSTYRGLSITSGTYTEIPLSLNLNRSIPQLKLEKNIISGFENNNLIYPRILNLEFLFNDLISPEYEINRYFGIYCNSIDLEEFDIDIPAMYNAAEDNLNSLMTIYKQSDTISYNLTNQNGVVLRGTNVESDLSYLNSALSNKDQLYFPYLKTKDQELHLLNIKSPTYSIPTFSQIGQSVLFSVDDTSFDIGKTFGAGDLFSQEPAVKYSLDTRAAVSVTINSTPAHLDVLRIYHPAGSIFNNSESHSKYDDIVFVNNYFTSVDTKYSLEYPTISIVNFNTSDPNSGSPTFSPNTSELIGTQYKSSINGSKWIWNGNSYIPGALGSRIYVNINNAEINSVGFTDLTQLAQTIATIVNNFTNTTLLGSSITNSVFIQVSEPGNSYPDLAIRYISPTSRIYINGKNTADIVYADGGFVKMNQPVISFANIENIKSELPNIIVKTATDWSKINRICNSTSILNSRLTESTLSNYLNTATLILEDKEEVQITYNSIELRKIVKPKLGILSMFEIKDFNFEYHSTQYSKIPELDLYQYYYIPKDIAILDFTKYVYRAIGSGIILVNETQYTISVGSTQYISQSLLGLHKYSVLSGNVILIQTNLIPQNQAARRLDIAILDQDQNFQNFTGFFGFGADHSAPDPNSVTYQYKEKFKTNNLISEYAAYLENYSAEFANDSKIIPYISKWGIIDSTDARGNPYRLNSDILFGKDNFGPSHREKSPNAEKLTHEWFYIESDFNYSSNIDLLKENYYYFNSPLDINLLISEASYFEKYFTYVPTLDNIELDFPQFRYSKLMNNSFSRQYNTLFNGIQFKFSEVDSKGLVLPGTTRFEDYNFSILLKPVPEDLINPQSPIKYRVIENINAKSILILIEVALGDISKISNELLSIPTDSDFARDNRVDQSNILTSNGLITEDQISSFQIDTIVELAVATTIKKLFFNNYYLDLIDAFTGATVTSAITGEAIVNDRVNGLYVPIAGETVLVKIAGGGAAIIFAFSESKLFNEIESGHITNGSVNNADTNQKFNTSKILPAYISTGISPGIYGPSNLPLPEPKSIINVVKMVDYRGIESLPVLTGLSKLNLNIVKPALLSIFGDYRISFNLNGVSNLTYAFLYAATDKKYNTTASAFSTVKLAVGVDLSPDSMKLTANGYFIPGANLRDLPKNYFNLEEFINPTSASHSTLTNPTNGDIAPLPAFSPLMFINSIGEISILLKTSAEFNNNLTNTSLDISRSGATTHALKTVNNNLLIIDSPTVIYDILSEVIPIITSTTTTTTSAGGTTTTTTVISQLNLEINYVGQSVLTKSFTLPSKFKIGDIVKIYAIAQPTVHYLIGAVTSVTETVSNAGNFYKLTVLVRSQTTASTSHVPDWGITCTQNIIVLKPAVVTNASTGVNQIILNKSNFPSGSSPEWLLNTQQFQLFGGKNYFLNLFKNLSFANFSELLLNNSDLISFESYMDGKLLPGKQIQISIEQADQVNKTTIISTKPEFVQTASQQLMGGVIHSESVSIPYEIFRYSGEYDIVYKPVSGFKFNSKLGSTDLSAANVFFNTEIKNFFTIPEFYLVKYAESKILDFEDSNTYLPIYPLINESPIDKTSYNTLSSSWDFNYHRLYTTKTDYTLIPGSRRITEDYSFVSKLINLPMSLTAESFNAVQVTTTNFEITDAQFKQLTINGQTVDIIYAIYQNEVKFKINLELIISKALIINGLRFQFNKFFRKDANNILTTDPLVFGTLTQEQYLLNYCNANLSKLYTLATAEFYIKFIPLVFGAADSAGLAPNLVNFSQVSYADLLPNGYSLDSDLIQINNTGSAILTGAIRFTESILRVSVVPKLKINYI